MEIFNGTSDMFVVYSRCHATVFAELRLDS
jgi:hypothetical protein